MPTPPWTDPSDAPVIEQSIHDYIVSIFRRVRGHRGLVEIIPISPGAEATRGYDAAVKEVVPLYFQYKLPDFTSRPQSSQPEVYRQRADWAFDDAGGLFHFRLRAKATHAPQSQHQLLFELARKGAHAYYVSPTFIDQQRLRFGGELIANEPYALRYMNVQYGDLLDRVEVPVLHDIICIPPCCSVDDPPESHQFFFNQKRQVSLHSDPVRVESLDLASVIDDQLRELVSGRALTQDSVNEHVNYILRSLSGEFRDERNFGLVSDYYRSMRSEIGTANELMISLRALARTVQDLSGVQMLLTMRL
ncbi:hypothetical protein ACN9MB_01250 [Dyella kyungheensis]|uniref:hypothetical protein n=1 Tax=Dyella kyungheensis TaxID=1242174 RepID=UPI003CF9C65E